MVFLFVTVYPLLSKSTGKAVPVHAVWACGAVKALHRSALTLVLGVSAYLYPSATFLRRNSPGTYCTGGWTGPEPVWTPRIVATHILNIDATCILVDQSLDQATLLPMRSLLYPLYVDDLVSAEDGRSLLLPEIDTASLCLSPLW